MDAIITIPAERSDVATRDGARRLVEAFLSGKSSRTLEAYGQDLEAFREWLGSPTVDDAARELLSGGHGRANELALRWRAALLEAGLSPGTINRRLSALRSMVSLARTLGMVGWTLECPGFRSQAYRDTTGPGVAGFSAMLQHINGSESPKACRDRAILRLLFDCGLRRAEVTGLDLEHVDLEAGKVSILGKGRREREPLTLPEPTRAALAGWLEIRGDSPGPLFTNMDRAGKGSGRLTGRSLHRIVQALGKAAGVGAVRPHGLRHAGITAALDLTRGDVRAVQRFSRHRSLEVLMRYDDNRQDMAGEVAALVAGVCPDPEGGRTMKLEKARKILEAYGRHVDAGEDLHPCKHGHSDCATVENGECTAEADAVVRGDSESRRTQDDEPTGTIYI